MLSTFRLGLVTLTAVATVVQCAETEVSHVSLDGSDWTATSKNGSVYIPATVPGHIYTDLLSAKKIENPYYRFADDTLAWVREDTWTFLKKFELQANGNMGSRVDLVFEGIDTVSDVFLNEHFLGSTNNQHRRYIFDITDYVSPTNILSVRIFPALDYAYQRADQYPYTFNEETFIPQRMTHRVFVRKQQSDFGWDWGPALVPAGVWRSVSLEMYSVRITDVVAFPAMTIDGAWEVHVKVYLRGVTNDMTGSITVAVAGQSGQIDLNNNTVVENCVSLKIAVPSSSVKLWWPNGYGEQPLYKLLVTLNGTSTSDSREQSFGFRTAEVVEDPITDPNNPGRSFYIRINGVSIFAKGGSWVPADAFDNRLTDKDLRQLLGSAVKANQNVVRIWGGGNYQRSSFYDICDELGIMIWLDFQHGGGQSPRDVDHVANWREEVVDNVRRVATHPSLVTYCGNNEGVKSISPPQVTGDPQALSAMNYASLFDNVVRLTVALEDPSRHFHASSPSNGYSVSDPEMGIFIHEMGDPFSGAYGETRHYDYDHYCLDVGYFPQGRFVSEFGWQSYPSFHSLKQYTIEEDWYWNSSWAQHVQHHPNGNPQLVAQNLIFFNPPSGTGAEEFQRFIQQTQAVQALCISTQSQYYRSLRNTTGIYTMGAVYWQLDQIWPAPSWSSLEFGGRWKLLHYYMKRSFEPILLFPALSNATDIEGKFVSSLSQNSVALEAISDCLTPISINITMTVWTWKGSMVKSMDFSVKIPPQSVINVFPATSVETLLPRRTNPEDAVLVFSGEAAEAQVAECGMTSAMIQNQLLLTPPKNATLPVTAPSVTMTVHGNSVTQSNSTTISIVSSAVTPLFTLETTLDGVFSDNGMLLLPNTEIIVTFEGWSPFSVASLRSDLTATTPVYDTIYKAS